MTESKGISIDCLEANHQVHLLITSDAGRGIVKILSDSGSRMSSTISQGSKVSYSVDLDQCPLKILYDTGGDEIEFTIDSEGVLN